MTARLFCTILVACGLALGALGTAAQSRPPTTEQLGKDPGALRQEADQQRAQERAQQQQSSQQQADQQWNDTLRRNQSRAAADAAQGEAVRRTWQQRPPLAPEQNRLLGRWESLGSGQRPAAGAAGIPPEIAKLAAELIGGMTSGLCDSMLGHGTVEFRPAGLVAIGKDGREHPMYRAEYRGGGSRVVVLPQGGTTFTHMIIDFSGADRAMVAGVGCGLRRAGGSDAARPMAMATAAAAADGPVPDQWSLQGATAANGGMDVYVSRSTIRRSGALASMAELWDFKSPRVFQGKRFLSVRNQIEYDCVATRRRMVATSAFSGHMGQGTTVASDKAGTGWDEVRSSGPFRDMWKVACNKS